MSTGTRTFITVSPAIVLGFLTYFIIPSNSRIPSFRSLMCINIDYNMLLSQALLPCSIRISCVTLNCADDECYFRWIIPSYIKSKRMVTIDMTVGLSAEALAIIKKYPVAQMEMPVYFLEKVKGASVPCKRQKRKFQTEVASAPAAKRIKRAAPVNSAPAQKQGKPVDKTTRAPRQKGQRLQKPAKPRTGSASSYSRVPSCYSSAAAITSQSKTPAWSLPLSGAPVSDRIKDWLVTVEPLRKGSRLVDFDYSLDNVCCGKDKHVRGCDCWTKGG